MIKITTTIELLIKTGLFFPRPTELFSRASYAKYKSTTGYQIGVNFDFEFQIRPKKSTGVLLAVDGPDGK